MPGSCPDHIYRVIELARLSEISHANAIKNAISRTSKTTRNQRWSSDPDAGEIEEGEVRHYQVAMKVGLTLEDRPGKYMQRRMDR